MIDLIIAQLKTGAIKNVAEFGGSSMSAPYIVVKIEPTDMGYTRVRTICHMLPGQQTALRLYIKKTIFNLLNGIVLSDTTRRCKLRSLDMSTLTVNSDDGTISLERAFAMPEIIT